MAIDNNGLHIQITGDSSQAVQAIQNVKQATEGIKDQKIDVQLEGSVDALGRLYKANEQFMTMGEKLAASFNSAFMKKTAELSVNLDSLGKKIEGVFAPVFKTITSTLQSVAHAVSGVMKSALSIGGGFEATMTSVQVVSSASADELDKLTAKAREMGATLPISAQQAGQAMLIMAQRGTKFADILTSVEDVANLAIFQGSDMQTAANLLGSTMSQFALDTKEASRIVDIFNNACNQSPLNMQLLVDAMQYVGPIAGGMGVKLEEVIAGLEALHNSGLVGSMAGTGLRMVFQKLAKETNIAGVETKNLDGNSRHLYEIFSELKANGYSVAQATKDFGARGANAAISLMKLSDSLKIYENGLQKAGTTSKGVQEKMKTFTNTLNAFRSASEELHIEIFDQIKNQAKDAVGSIADLTRLFSKWVRETQIAGDALNAFLDGLGFKLPSVDNLQSLLRNFNVQGFLNNVKSFGNALKGITDSIIGAFNMIKVPLAFLIEHLGAFTTISFWGWILGKGLQIPAAILGIAASFKELYAIAKLLLGLSWSAILSPIGAIAATGAIITTVVGSKVFEAKKAEQDFNDTIERIQNEIKLADKDLTIHINTDFITGFENLPESYFKASDELRDKTNSMIRELQSAFRDKYAKAVDYVAEKFPDLTAAALQSGLDIDNANKDTIQQITNALHGGEEEFKKLSPFLQAVVEQINLLDIYAGKGSEALLEVIQKVKEVKQEAENINPENKFEIFFQRISDSIDDVLRVFPTLIEQTNKALNGVNPQLAFSVAFSKAQDSFKALAKDMSKEFEIPKEVILESLTQKLKDLAAQGNNTAEALHGFMSGFQNITPIDIKALNDAIYESCDILDNFLLKFQGLRNTLKDSDISDVTAIYLQHLQSQLDKSVHDIADKFNLPVAIVKEKIISRLKEYAAQGDLVSQSLLNSWGNLSKPFDDLLNKAQEAINYIGASPQQFLPVLNSMAKGIQKIDPITGKLTEQFKKAHDAIKHLADVTFNQLTERIQKLRKAVEGGFIDKSVLEKEVKTLLPQLKLQIYSELEPVKEHFSSNSDYRAVIASELVSKVTELFGEAGQKVLSEIYSGKTGEEIGRSILLEVGKALDSANTDAFFSGLQLRDSHMNLLNSSLELITSRFEHAANLFNNHDAGFLSINGIEQSLNNSATAFSNEIDSLKSRFSNLDSALMAFGERALHTSDSLARSGDSILGLINSIKTPSSNNTSASVFNYSELFANVIKELVSLNSAAKDNISAVHSVTDAVRNIHLQPINENNIAGAILNGLNPLTSAFDNLKSSNMALANDFSNLAGGIEALRVATEHHTTAVSSLQNSNSPSLRQQDLSSALNPLLNALQNIHNSMASLPAENNDKSQSLHDILVAVRDLSSIISHLSSGNTYNIDIQQQGLILDSKSDADYIAQNTVNAIRSGLGNGGV